MSHAYEIEEAILKCTYRTVLILRGTTPTNLNDARLFLWEITFAFLCHFYKLYAKYGATSRTLLNNLRLKGRFIHLVEQKLDLFSFCLRF